MELARATELARSLSLGGLWKNFLLFGLKIGDTDIQSINHLRKQHFHLQRIFSTVLNNLFVFFLDYGN